MKHRIHTMYHVPSKHAILTITCGISDEKRQDDKNNLLNLTKTGVDKSLVQIKQQKQMVRLILTIIIPFV